MEARLAARGPGRGDGTMPAMSINVVIRIGRKRVRLASMMAQRRVRFSSLWCETHRCQRDIFSTTSPSDGTRRCGDKLANFVGIFGSAMAKDVGVIDCKIPFFLTMPKSRKMPRIE